jgi:transposase
MVRRLILTVAGKSWWQLLRGRIIPMQIHPLHRPGQDYVSLCVARRSREGACEDEVTQRQLLTYSANLQTSLIGLEACSGALFLGRALWKQGHYVRLIPVKSIKNDFVDAEAIAEAVDRENMRFVPITTGDQLDLQAIHGVCDRLISRRTTVINQLRAFLLERGMAFATRSAWLEVCQWISETLEKDSVVICPAWVDLLTTLQTTAILPKAIIPGIVSLKAWLIRAESVKA